MDKFNLNLEKDTLPYLQINCPYNFKTITNWITSSSGYCKYWTIVDNILITYDIIYDNIQVQIYCFLVAKIML